MGGGTAMHESDFGFPGLLYGLVWLALIYLVMSLAVPLIIALVVAVLHFRLRADRELLEGTDTIAAYGSRAGSRLGMSAGLLVSGGWTLVTLLSMTGDQSFGLYSGLMCLLGVVPAGAWGMLSGSIAGHRSSERTAGVPGALLFLLLAEPLSSLSSLMQLVQRPDDFYELFLPLLAQLAVSLSYVLAGAVTGVLAVRAGRERYAEGRWNVSQRAVNPWVPSAQG